MNNFKVGDVIECVDDVVFLGLKKSDRYVVSRTFIPDLICITKLINDDDSWIAARPCFFRLVNSNDKPMAHMFSGESHE